jgi:CheY-like chemotaxis protein
VRKPGTSDRQLVLIVDDDELVRWSAAEGLKESGYSVEVAANAPEALQRCADAAVALLDHDLPDVDGLALADTLRRRHPRCAVVLMTADLTPELRREAGERGVVGVLEKPFSLEDLVDAIRGALGHSPASPSPPVGPGGRGDEGPWETGAPHGV